MLVTEDTKITTAPRSRKLVLYIAAGALGVFLIAWIGLAIFAKRIEPYLKAQVIRDLSERFDGTVEMGRFQVTVAPTLRVHGENVVVHGAADGKYPPLVTIAEFDFAASLVGLLSWPLSIGSAHVKGLTITLPPRGQRPHLLPSGKSSGKSGGGRTLFVIHRIVCDNTRLELLTDKPGKLPLVFDIHSLTLDSVGPGRAMPYAARLTEPKPLGEIDSKGEFGPWQTGQPRDTPVSGVYSFTHADLATIKGIGGILSSTGNFAGHLDQIEVKGQTDTPDFTVSTGGHPMPLHTDFSATVDGTNGDTYLHPVNAKLGRSFITANGSVVRQKPHGHLITLDVTASDAQIEDFLKVAVKTLPPALSGPINLKAKLVLPPEQRVVAQRIQLNGTFDLPAAHFNNVTAQTKLDQLSLRAQGHPEESKQEDGGPDVLSMLQGSFTLKDGVITMPAFHFSLPGAAINLAGTYEMADQHFQFTGTARLQAKPSQLTTGIKSFFLKALDPFFSKGGAGTVLPIEISGTQGHPSVGLHLGHSKQ